MTKRKMANYIQGMGSVIIVNGGHIRFNCRADILRKTDREWTEETWRQVGRDLKTAIDEYAEENGKQIKTSSASTTESK